MTENNTPTCDRCGTPMERFIVFPDQMVCPFPESACQSIGALRSENEALRKRNEELENESRTLTDDRDLCASERDKMVRIVSAAESRAQELETKLRAAEDAVVAITSAALEYRAETGHLHMAIYEESGKQYPWPALDAADEELMAVINRASTLAAQRKREIVREALDRLASAAEKQPYESWPLCNAAGDPYNASELREAFAIILHPTEPA